MPGAATEVYEVVNIAYSACFVLDSGFTQLHDFKMTHLCCITVAWRHLTCVKQHLPSRKSLQPLCGYHQGFRVCSGRSNYRAEGPRRQYAASCDVQHVTQCQKLPGGGRLGVLISRPVLSAPTSDAVSSQRFCSTHRHRCQHVAVISGDMTRMLNTRTQVCGGGCCTAAPHAVFAVYNNWRVPVVTKERLRQQFRLVGFWFKSNGK